MIRKDLTPNSRSVCQRVVFVVMCFQIYCHAFAVKYMSSEERVSNAANGCVK